MSADHILIFVVEPNGNRRSEDGLDTIPYFSINDLDVREGYRQLRERHPVRTLYRHQDPRIEPGEIYVITTDASASDNFDDWLNVIFNIESGKQGFRITLV